MKTFEKDNTSDLRVFSCSFHSKANDYLKGEDRNSAVNRDFTFQLLKPDDGHAATSIILLLHGLNEKNWDKYRSWGESLCRQTNSAVLFFPIAFHMQRAPQNWSDRREMYNLSVQRQKQYPGLQCSSLSNAAISERIQQQPERLFWSGLESYYDVLQLIKESQEGKYEQINKDFNLHIFGFSIGGFLAELLKLANPQGLFTKSKLCLFCSGPVLKGFSPVSRYILDSEANRALQEFLSYKLHKNLDVLAPTTKEVFLSMVDYAEYPELRKEKLLKYGNDIYAISLIKDHVSPPTDVYKTLKGDQGDLHTFVEAMDFRYPYIHENPFSARGSYQKESTRAFNKIFKKFSSFLSAS